MEVVKEEDKIIILEEKNKKRIGGVYANGRWQGKIWKKWLEKLEEGMGREGSILGEWNAHSHSWNETTEEDSKGKIMEEWIVRTG